MFNLPAVGTVIQFKKGINEMECCIDPGMKGRVVSVRLIHQDTDDSYVIMKVNLEEFAEYNKLYEQSNYYNKYGEPVLTAREAGFYEEVETIYLDIDLTKYFDVVPTTAVYEW